MKLVDVFGVSYAVTDYQGAVSQILNAVERKVAFKVFALPVHGVIEYQLDAQFKQAVDCADMIVADGQPIRWSMNYFHNAGLKDRVYGPFLMQHLLSQASRRGLRVYLYGGKSEDVLAKLSSHIAKQYPGVTLCGQYREEDISQATLSRQTLLDSAPDLIFVGLGCPRQEKWIDQHASDLNTVSIGVGAAFSFLAGEVKMAPRWMQNAGLEWLYRLISEPKRLWRRYFYYNSYFIYLVIKKLCGRQPR